MDYEEDDDENSDAAGCVEAVNEEHCHTRDNGTS